MNGILILSTALCTGIVLTNLFEKRIVHLKNGLERTLHLKGLHFHHSLYGLFLLVLGIFFFNGAAAYALNGAGAGIIFQHTLAEKKFVFINKTTKEDIKLSHYHQKRLERDSKK